MKITLELRFNHLIEAAVILLLLTRVTAGSLKVECEHGIIEKDSIFMRPDIPTNCTCRVSDKENKNQNLKWHDSLGTVISSGEGQISMEIRLREGPTHCPEGWRLFTPHDSLSVTDVRCVDAKTDGSWSGNRKEALNYCVHRGGFLPKPRSKEYWIWMRQNWPQFYVMKFWLGARIHSGQDSGEIVYRWDDDSLTGEGSLISKTSWNDWAENEPNLRHANSCVMALSKKHWPQWDDVHCTDRADAVMCERGPVVGDNHDVPYTCEGVDAEGYVVHYRQLSLKFLYGPHVVTAYDGNGNGFVVDLKQDERQVVVICAVKAYHSRNGPPIVTLNVTGKRVFTAYRKKSDDKGTNYTFTFTLSDVKVATTFKVACKAQSAPSKNFFAEDYFELAFKHVGDEREAGEKIGFIGTIIGGVLLLATICVGCFFLRRSGNAEQEDEVLEPLGGSKDENQFSKDEKENLDQDLAQNDNDQQPPQEKVDNTSPAAGTPKSGSENAVDTNYPKFRLSQ